MTPRQFHAFLDGKVQAERRQAELVRAQTFLIASLSPHLKKGTTPRKFWPLPWDNENAPVFPKQTKEERDAWRERAKQILDLKHKRERANDSAT